MSMYEDIMEAESREEMAAIQRQRDLLMKLNKAELLCLAKHFKIRNPEFYAEPYDWKFGGKEELAFEIAERMIDAA